MPLIGNEHVSVYAGNPTAGGTDGTILSNGSGSHPISFTLNIDNRETGITKCAIRCSDGYQTVGPTVISFKGITAQHWKACSDNYFTSGDISEGFKSSLEITDSITDKNTIFWVRADSNENEMIGRDITVTMNVKGLVIPQNEYEDYIAEQLGGE